MRLMKSNCRILSTGLTRLQVSINLSGQPKTEPTNRSSIRTSSTISTQDVCIANRANPFRKQSSLTKSFSTDLNRSPVITNKRDSYLQTRKENDIFFIKFNRAAKRNCLDLNTIESLKRLLYEIDQDASIEKVVIYGDGKHFCSGFDLNELKEENRQKLIDLLSDANWFRSDKLLISYVQGYAVGLGFELVLASDIRIADESSKFGFLNRRFGLPSFLPLRRCRNLIGRLKAIELLDNPTLMSSKEAHDIGLINYLINDESSFEQILSSIDQNQSKMNRSTLDADLRIRKFTHLPDEWKTHGLSATNYNVNKSEHGKFKLSYWEGVKDLISLKRD